MAVTFVVWPAKPHLRIMKYLATLLFSGFLLPALAQQPQFDVRSLSLPKELATEQK